MFNVTPNKGVLQLAYPRSEWVSSGWDGGFTTADAAYNISVPTNWEHTDLDTYAENRRNKSGFSSPGPTLFTGVSVQHAYAATVTDVTVIATAGLSNPTTIPEDTDVSPSSEDGQPAGTVNLLIAVDQHLSEHALLEILSGAVEAKTLTLYRETGIPSTTTDAVIAGCSSHGPQNQFAGSATELGAATRICTRDAILASLQSHYPDQEYPTSMEDAAYGSRLSGHASVNPVID